MNVFESQSGRRWAAYHVDTVEFTAEMPDDVIDLSVFSPPFANLYIYSDSERDMGNVGSDREFQDFYRHLVRELFRVTKPGRLCAIHVKDLVYYSNASAKGDRGLRDFTGDCIRTHLDEGWTYHRRITIDRCPVREMQKTKADRLLYKNFRTDGARSGGGLPEYIVLFRKWSPGLEDTPRILHDAAEHPLESWQDLAQPIWTTDGARVPRGMEWLIEDIWRGTDETDVLNARVARDDNAERHLCPMPLDLTGRLVTQYSMPDETVYSPFMGIGSEGFQSLRQGRQFIGTEIEKKYYKQALKYLAEAERLGPAGNLFAKAAAG